jgi:DNA-3-methyladenine glycosylase
LSLDPRNVEFYDRSVHDVARDLVGCVVRHGETSGRIVEVESYHQEEPACHAFAGLTPRTEVLFGPPGLAYVYRSYGIHALLNAVSESEGVGAAVLIRALEPLERLLCSGPGKLTQALGIWLDLNGTPLTGGGPIELLPRAGHEPEIVDGVRIGITKAADLPWRFVDATRAHYVSRPLPQALRRVAA